MPNKLKLKVEGDEVTIEKGSDSLLSKLMAGTKGKIIVKTPFGKREIHKVKDYKGKVIR